MGQSRLVISSDIFIFLLDRIRILDSYLLFKYRWCSLSVKVNTVKRAAESSFVRYLNSSRCFNGGEERLYSTEICG